MYIAALPPQSTVEDQAHGQRDGHISLVPRFSVEEKGEPRINCVHMCLASWETWILTTVFLTFNPASWFSQISTKIQR